MHAQLPRVTCLPAQIEYHVVHHDNEAKHSTISPVATEVLAKLHKIDEETYVRRQRLGWLVADGV